MSVKHNKILTNVLTDYTAYEHMLSMTYMGVYGMVSSKGLSYWDGDSADIRRYDSYFKENIATTSTEPTTLPIDAINFIDYNAAKKDFIGAGTHGTVPTSSDETMLYPEKGRIGIYRSSDALMYTGNDIWLRTPSRDIPYEKLDGSTDPRNNYENDKLGGYRSAFNRALDEVIDNDKAVVTVGNGTQWGAVHFNTAGITAPNYYLLTHTTATTAYVMLDHNVDLTLPSENGVLSNHDYVSKTYNSRKESDPTINRILSYTSKSVYVTNTTSNNDSIKNLVSMSANINGLTLHFYLFRDKDNNGDPSDKLRGLNIKCSSYSQPKCSYTITASYLTSDEETYCSPTYTTTVSSDRWFIDWSSVSGDNTHVHPAADTHSDYYEAGEMDTKLAQYRPYMSLSMYDAVRKYEGTLDIKVVDDVYHIEFSLFRYLTNSSKWEHHLMVFSDRIAAQ